ncbi:chymotrypsin A-like [Toxorhynchites rutilus septentrionalis]|uniref:chymotrypsin A-like n=1 Tax=Toxorhynchites rutilus septentrionalis TaxID=329112 RepID=UPI0024789DBE|nr:chymotrypsin A-like [Toxorhynchites rutilus septentrionalis]
MLSCALLVLAMIVRHTVGWPIVNGKAAPNPDQFRFAVSLQRHAQRTDGKLKHFCGGTYIGRGWILTANHCVVGFETSSIFAQIGGQSLNNVSEHATVYKIDEKIIYPDYNRVTLAGDIALLRVAEAEGAKYHDRSLPVAAANSNHSALNLLSGREHYEATSGQWESEECHIFGYGSSSYNGAGHSTLQYGPVRWLDHRSCVRMLGPVVAPVAPNRGMFCAIGLADACKGDSGGGLVCRQKIANKLTPYTLRGIISYGAGCGVPASPGVYTDVGYYRVWLDRFISM